MCEWANEERHEEEKPSLPTRGLRDNWKREPCHIFYFPCRTVSERTHKLGYNLHNCKGRPF